ncbi:OsmC family peroxiredoxin [Hahella sp. KA22]|uniref:OsmC family protein n=1 Tax=Hahella sp. KA22 TaxID=1628392 RepID=UPI000FDD5750|nr:OsmC family protein [Hahella sp. KA22]AZZ93930.1 OsmC family peroxiredoxin [Hahella sp. KA22]QAY57304.1 OsmC family peroxiredoxin [Hahella sp. KA22]
MSEYFATVRWLRGAQDFLSNQYSRGHEWEFDGGVRIPASASPHIVPLPFSVAENVDPEEAFVASLSSCHMLFFLAYAAKRKFVVDSYEDPAIGVLAKNEQGVMMMTQVRLRPRVEFSGSVRPTREELEALHHRAHESCFIANSVKTEVVVELDAWK